MPIRVVTLALAAVVSVPAQVAVHGLVQDGADSSPVAGARVMAVAGRPPRIVAAGETDSQGRYRFDSPEARFELTLEAQGYFISRAGDIEGTSIARICPENNECEATDFVLSRAAVLDGWVTDKYGNPKASIELRLAPASADEGGPPGGRRLPIRPTQERNRNRVSVSDDRGYYRFWGLRPGTYSLKSRRSGTRFMSIPDPPNLDETIEIPAGEEAIRLNFQLRAPLPTFLVSGTLEGLEPGDLRWITLEALEGGGRQSVYVNEGEFSQQVEAGVYAARLERVANAHPAEHQADYLATLTVDRDLENLRLRPQPPTGVRARAVFVDTAPGAFRLRLTSKEPPNVLPREIFFATDASEIRRHGFLPGKYAGRITNGGDLYLIDPLEVAVVAGQLTEVELRLSDQRSVVRGAVRFPADAGRGEAAQVTVGIRGREVRSVQTDDAGGFVFEKLIPGEYEIAAWPRRGVRIERDEPWQQAGEHVKRIEVDAGFEVEVGVTIAP